MLFVYPYKKPRGFDGLKYSLESLKVYKDHKVLILGDTPKFKTFAEVVELPIDKHNTTEQALGKCYSWLIDNLPATDIIWMNDDIYALKYDKNIGAPKILGDLSHVRTRGANRWCKLLWKTYDRCKSLGLSTFNFETHLPYCINTTTLKLVSEQFDILTGDVLLATAYFNFLNVKPNQCNNKLSFYRPNPRIEELPEHLWLNHDDHGLTSELVSFIKTRWPTC